METRVCRRCYYYGVESANCKLDTPAKNAVHVSFEVGAEHACLIATPEKSRIELITR